jgi:hypothetical protein
MSCPTNGAPEAYRKERLRRRRAKPVRRRRGGAPRIRMPEFRTRPRAALRDWAVR